MPDGNLSGDKITKPEHLKFDESVERTSFAIFLLTGAISLTVVIGWQAQVPALVHLLPYLPPVRFNCALLQFLSATSLLMVNLGKRFWARAFGLALVCGSLLFLIQHLSGINLGIDTLFVSSHVFRQDAHPGRISLWGSIGFLLVGLASCCLTSRELKRRQELLIVAAGTVCLAIGVTATFALLWGLRDPGDITRFHGITPQGAFFFSLIGAGINWHLGRRVSSRENYRRIIDENNAHLAALVRSSDDAIYSVDLRGNVLAWNHGAKKLYGYTTEEMIGQSVLKLSPTESHQSVRDAIDKVRKGESLGNYEAWRVRKNGQQILISFTVSPVWSGGKVSQISVIGRDITERKRNHDNVQKLAMDLSRSNEELEQFAAIASHDLQEPLRMISSYLMLLTQRYQQRLDQDARDFIHFAADGASRMRLLVDGLLHYSRMGNNSLHLREVDSRVVVRKALMNLQEAIKESDAQVTIGALPTITADHIQLVQLFQNLIGNAIKYRNGERPHIRLNCESKDGKNIFSVADNGIGIHPEDHDKLFKLFHRLHRKRIAGTGIGLATCKKIVERHGGEIWVESEPEKGTTFYFSLPNVM